MSKKVLLISLLFLILFTIKIEGGLIVNSKLVHQYEVKVGEKRYGEIKLKNDSKNEIMVRLYQRDYSFNSAGENFYNNPGSNSSSNAEWMLLQEQLITLPPFGKKSFQYIITIPDKRLKGTYWSMVMIEEYKIHSTNGNEILKSQVNQNVRYGIQIVTNLGKKGNMKLEYKNPEVIMHENNKYIFRIDIVNNGIFELITKPKIIVTNEKTGEIVNTYERKQIRLYPNTSIAVKEKISLDKNVPYKIIVIVGNNRRGYYGKEYSIGVGSD
ncbi:MAG: hypothetical protein K9K76_04220 [Halanaerobiales bacterium]|nr:hypothetical protein [Halanaerobiales bacterium]